MPDLYHQGTPLRRVKLKEYITSVPCRHPSGALIHITSRIAHLILLASDKIRYHISIVSCFG
jgi:hypothetical protein